MEEPVTLIDRDVLKILSVDTRMDILKILSEGDRTPSDISKKLKKTDATIVEHLDALCKVGLVKRTEQPGKRWVFYSLTEKGEGIIKSKSRRLVIVLGTSILTGIAGMSTFGKYLYDSSAPVFAPLASESKSLGADIQNESIKQILSSEPIQWILYASLALIAISIGGIAFYFYKMRKMRSASHVKI